MSVYRDGTRPREEMRGLRELRAYCLVQTKGPCGDAGRAAGSLRRMYAIFEDGSHQFRVREGDPIVVDRRDGETGDEVVFPKVLLLAGDDSAPVIGAPVVEGARVVAKIVRQFKGDKIVIQKFRRRKNMRRRNGHRQSHTTRADHLGRRPRLNARRRHAAAADRPGPACGGLDRSFSFPSSILPREFRLHRRQSLRHNSRLWTRSQRLVAANSPSRPHFA